MNQEYFVYIATNKRKTVYYTGVTNDLAERMNQHYFKDNPKSFTAKYNIDQLVYYEIFDSIADAIFREKQIKKYSRKKKLVLINSVNPYFKNLLKEEL